MPVPILVTFNYVDGAFTQLKEGYRDLTICDDCIVICTDTPTCQYEDRYYFTDSKENIKSHTYLGDNLKIKRFYRLWSIRFITDSRSLEDIEDSINMKCGRLSRAIQGLQIEGKKIEKE